MRLSEPPEVDAVVIGAGFSGLYMTKKLVDLGLSVRAFDAGAGVGGVWNWNRYPGARTDSQHHTYCFSFSDELLDEWRYRDRYPDQAQVTGYLQHFADKFDVLRHYRFETTVTSAHYDDDTAKWVVATDRGDVVAAKYFVPAVGLVSEPNTPALRGLDSFEGPLHHTSRWPLCGVSFAGRRVAVIGTGSSGIQIVPQIAAEAASLTVFQRTPNYVVPSGNRAVTEDEHTRIREHYDEVWRLVRQNRAGHPYPPTGRLALEVTPAERERVFEEAWSRGGHSMVHASFDDVMINREANELACEFLRAKIRAIVRDPATAEALVPDYPYGAKRPPIGDGYFEAFNRPNVELVDLRREPIVEVVPSGIRTGARTLEFDVVVLATGFDASTGAYLRIDVRGRRGELLIDHWRDGPKTYLGLGVAGFPNLFLIAGPQTPFSNLPPAAEQEANWIADCIGYLRRHQIAAIEPAPDAEQRWTAHVAEAATSSQAAFGKDVNSWFFGANIEGKPRVPNVYFGGAHVYAARCEEEAAAGYPGFRRYPAAAGRPDQSPASTVYGDAVTKGSHDR